jgi:hypothetical protein
MSALDANYRGLAIPSTPIKIFVPGSTECCGGMATNARVAMASLGEQAR